MLVAGVKYGIVSIVGPTKPPYEIRPLGQQQFEGQTTSGVNGQGVAHAWHVSGRGYVLTVLDVRWDNGERDIRAGEVVTGRPAIQHLGKGHRRIGVHAIGKSHWIELRMARIKAGTTNEWTTTVDADENAWQQVLGTGWREHLERAFGVQIGTKEALLAANDRTRNRLCAVVPKTASTSILPNFFVLTRVLPLHMGLSR